MKTPIERHMQQRNQESLDDFHGLSPEQMYRMLHFPFASPELVRLPEVLTTSPTAPIVTLFVMLLEAIGDKGLKPTAKGNLPQKFCREATLDLLMRYGDTWRPHEFYEDRFLRAFPMLPDELPQHQVFTPEEEVRRCYTWRTLVNFVGFFGLAAVEPVSDKRFCHEYRVKGLPLLHASVQFQLSG